MPTKLFLRDSKLSGIGIFRSLTPEAGSGVAPLGQINTAASGTQIQWKNNGQTEVLEWISGASPAGGWTLSGTVSFSAWCRESNMNANCGVRARLFKRTAAGVESEIGGGPFDDGVEFGTAAGEMTWTGTPTSTAFAENDRLIVRLYITNVGTMASGYVCELDYGAPDASQGDSFIELTETVAFKGEPQSLSGLGEIASAEAFGTATVLAHQSISGLGEIASAEAFGSPTITPVTSVTIANGIASAEAFDNPTLEITSEPRFLTDAGAIASAEAFGTASVVQNIAVQSSIDSAEAFDTPALTPVVSPSSVASAEAFGAATFTPAAVNITIADGIASAEAFGVPTIPAPVAQISPSSIASEEAFGAPEFSGGLVIEYFPHADLQDSRLFSISRDDMAWRAEIEGGYEVSRPIFKGASRRTFKSGFTYVDATVKADLEEFWRDVGGGTDYFYWTNPADDVNYLVRFVKPIEFKYRGIGDLKRWDVTFELREAVV